MIKSLGIAVLLTITLVATASAFDGTRKGFVLGGGLGLGPVASISVDGLSSASEDKSGLALNLLIGYAWDEQNMLVYLRDGVLFSVDVALGKSVNAIQGFSGLGWYHYFGPVGHTAFVVGGLGLQDYTSLDSDYESNDPGFGMLLGGGYEFARHIQVHGALSFGKTSFSVVDFNHSQIVITVTAIAF